MIDMQDFVRSIATAPQDAKRIVIKSAFEAIIAELGAALSQALPTDDQIIIEHIRAAKSIATLALQEVK
jgi:hypothetical protein